MVAKVLARCIYVLLFLTENTIRRADNALPRVEERLNTAVMISTQKVKKAKGRLSRSLLREENVHRFFGKKTSPIPHKQLLAQEAQKEELDQLAEAGETLLPLMQDEIFSKEAEAEEHISALEQLLHQQSVIR